jgi:hypothetical protein
MTATPSFRFCDDLGPNGFGWTVDEPMARTCHALAADGRVWLVDPLDWPEAIDRALASSKPAGVLQLLDRHNRDCAAIASRLDVPHLVAPDAVPESPFDCVPLVRGRFWHETALWWPRTQTLVVAEAVGTNAFFTGGKAPVGTHILLRLTPPKALRSFEPTHLLTGHGEGLHGPDVTIELRRALAESRRRLPGVLARLPFAGRSSSGTSAREEAGSN